MVLSKGGRTPPQGTKVSLRRKRAPQGTKTRPPGQFPTSSNRRKK